MSAPRMLAIAFGAGRIAYAAYLAAVPRRSTSWWLGGAADEPGGRVAIRALAARDALLSTGIAVTALRGEPVRPWLGATVASDVADIAASLGDGGGLPKGSPAATVAVAGGAALAGAALAVSVDR